MQQNAWARASLWVRRYDAPPMSHRRLFATFLLCLLLPWLLGARGCARSDTSVQPLPPGAPFRFEDYGDTEDGLRGPEQALALMAHEAHREELFSRALDGSPPALRFWAQMEAMCQGSGKEVAIEHSDLVCAVIPQLGCELDTSVLHALIPGEQSGAQRLRQLFLEAYAAEWERQRPGFKVKANLARGTLLLGAAVLSVRSGMGPNSNSGGTPAREQLKAAEVRTAATTAEVRAATETAASQEGVAATAARSRAAADASVGRARSGTQRLLATDSLQPSLALTPEVIEALEVRLLSLEAEVPALGRQTASLENLATLRPSVTAPPASATARAPLWRDYVAYWHRRFTELEAAQRSGRTLPDPPLYWDAYVQLRTRFQAGLEFQRTITAWLREEASRPTPKRTVHRGMQSPRVDDNVGLRPASHSGLTYVDQLVLDEASLVKGATPRVESYSCKMRSFHGWNEDQIRTQVTADAREALSRYGGEVEVRRPHHPLFGRTVPISKVHLVYESRGAIAHQEAITQAAARLRVEVHFR